jgi:hypothetical protein
MKSSNFCPSPFIFLTSRIKMYIIICEWSRFFYAVTGYGYLYGLIQTRNNCFLTLMNYLYCEKAPFYIYVSIHTPARGVTWYKSSRLKICVSGVSISEVAHFNVCQFVYYLIIVLIIIIIFAYFPWLYIIQFKFTMSVGKAWCSGNRGGP